MTALTIRAPNLPANSDTRKSLVSVPISARARLRQLVHQFKLWVEKAADEAGITPVSWEGDKPTKLEYMLARQASNPMSRGQVISNIYDLNRTILDLALYLNFSAALTHAEWLHEMNAACSSKAERKQTDPALLSAPSASVDRHHVELTTPVLSGPSDENAQRYTTSTAPDAKAKPKKRARK